MATNKLCRALGVVVLHDDTLRASPVKSNLCQSVQCDLDVFPISIKTSKISVQSFRRNKRRAGTTEWIENQIVFSAEGQDQLLRQRHREHCWVLNTFFDSANRRNEHVSATTDTVPHSDFLPSADRAVAADSTFASAWRAMAVNLGNSGAPASQVAEASARA